MKRKGILSVVCVLVALCMMSCNSKKKDRAESARLCQEATALMGKNGATLEDHEQARQKLNRAIELDEKNIAAYTQRMLNELNLWMPDDAYRTAGLAIDAIGKEDVNRLKGEFYLMRACVAYDRGDEADFKTQLKEALGAYNCYLQQFPMELEYLSSKAVILGALEGRESAVNFINGLPVSEENRQTLLTNLSEYRFESFGETWRAKHESLKMR